MHKPSGGNDALRLLREVGERLAAVTDVQAVQREVTREAQDYAKAARRELAAALADRQQQRDHLLRAYRHAAHALAATRSAGWSGTPANDSTVDDYVETLVTGDGVFSKWASRFLYVKDAQLQPDASEAQLEEYLLSCAAFIALVQRELVSDPELGTLDEDLHNAVAQAAMSI